MTAGAAASTTKAASAATGSGGPAGASACTSSTTTPVSPARAASRRLAEPLAGEQHPRSRIPQDRGDLGGRIVGVEGHDDATDGENGQVGGTPVGVVVREDRAAVAGEHAGVAQPTRAVRGQLLKGAIGVAIDRVLALDLDGRAIAEAPDRLFENAIQVRHAAGVHSITNLSHPTAATTPLPDQRCRHLGGDHARPAESRQENRRRVIFQA